MRVLLRGGRREVGATGAPGAPAVAVTVGEGVEDDIFEELVAGDCLLGSSFDSLF